MSRTRIAGLIVSAIVLLAGCNNAGNENANTNRAATNANTAVATNTNSNANDNRRLGPTREDYERNKEKYMKEAKDAGRKVGAGVSDGWLWLKTRYELGAADDLRDSTINVDAENGVVTLTGTVPTPAQRTRAEQIAKSVEGVTSVKNLIKVAPPSPSPKPTATPKKVK